MMLQECSNEYEISSYWKSGASKDGIVVSQPPPPRPPLIRQKTLRPPASCVVILAHLVLVRLHLGQDVENVGEDFLHGPQFRFGDGETGEQGGLQTYTPTSLCTRPSSAPSGTPGLLPRVQNGTRISAPSFRLNRVFRSLLGARSARPEDVAAAIFPASPFRLENEMAGTDSPPREAPATMKRKSYRMVSVGGSRPLASFCSSRSPCSYRRPAGSRLPAPGRAGATSPVRDASLMLVAHVAFPTLLR